MYMPLTTRQRLFLEKMISSKTMQDMWLIPNELVLVRTVLACNQYDHIDRVTLNSIMKYYRDTIKNRQFTVSPVGKEYIINV